MCSTYAAPATGRPHTKAEIQFWSSFLKGAAKYGAKYASDIVGAINSGEAQDYDDNDAEAQWLGAAIELASALAPLIHG